jgi:hypothetical protein
VNMRSDETDLIILELGYSGPTEKKQSFQLIDFQ